MVIEGIQILDFNADASKEVAKIFNRLRSKNQIIEFRDIFIAAICISNNLPLKTFNLKHFSRIEDLDLV